MSKFKTGDKVQLLHMDRGSAEADNWSSLDELKMGETYEVMNFSEVHFEDVGGIILTDKRFIHQVDKFKLVGESEQKQDAYITGVTVSVTTIMTPNGKVLVSAYDLHKYNLLSEEEFKEKHPYKLKFKEWHVKVKGDIIQFGCEEWPHKDVNAFFNVCRGLHGHKTSLDDAYTWLRDHSKELNLVIEDHRELPF